MGMYLAGGGLVGLAAYAYFYGPGAKFTDVKVQMADAAQKVEEKVAPATNTESPLDPKNYKAFKLKSVEPHTHNTARCVHPLKLYPTIHSRSRAQLHLRAPGQRRVPAARRVLRILQRPGGAQDRQGEASRAPIYAD
jgi:hypothetical protein